MELDIESLIGGFEELVNPPVSKSENLRRESLEVNDRCGDCNSFDIVVLNGEVICRTCGSINDTVIDSHAEWRFYVPILNIRSHVRV